MTDDRPIRVQLDDAVATVTLSRPEALNALTPELLGELAGVLEELAELDSIRVVVLTGEGRAFSAGVDLKALEGVSVVDGAVGAVLDVPARRVIDLVTTMPKIVVAKVNGHCFTGALELVLACDLAVAAEDAKLGDTHARFGLRPTWGMSQRLIRMVGVARARALSYTARTFTGADAAAWGIAVAAVPAADLDTAVAGLVSDVLAMSDGSLRAYKDLYRVALDEGLAEGLTHEAETRYAITDSAERLGEFGA